MPRFALGAVLIVVAVGFANAAVASATVVEPNGLTVPQDSMNGDTQLYTFFANAGESIDWQADARSGPGTFFPAPGSSITFVLNQAAFHYGLAWYNATGTAPSPSDLHTIIPPNSAVGTSVTGNSIAASPQYTGGLIGFALVGGQTHYSQNQFNPACSDPSFCTVGPWILALQYTSTKTAMSAYLAFEDGTATSTAFANDGDFNDDVFLLSGMLPAQCSDGIDNDGDGKSDSADRGCWSGPGWTYNPQDNSESDDPPLPAVTLPAKVASTITATVTQVGTGVGSCVISLDGNALPTTVASGPPTTCTATAPPTLAAGTHAVTVSYTETFGTVATASSQLVKTTVPVLTAAPRIAGSAGAGHRLTCETGTWTQNPTSFTYGWSRNGTPIAGAKRATYVVQPIDEGNTLTCTVTASNAAGRSAPATSAGIRVPVPVVKGCPAVTGTITGSAIGPVKLGDTRRQAHRAFPHSSNRGKKYEDFFCFTPSGIRVGYASPKLLKTLPRAERKRYAGRVIWISTASAHYAIAGIRPGATVAAASKALKLIGPFVVGANTWYLARDGHGTAVFKVRHQLIQEIGIGVTALTKNSRAQRTFLTSFE
jgi:hypothetical protein